MGDWVKPIMQNRGKPHLGPRGGVHEGQAKLVVMYAPTEPDMLMRCARCGQISAVPVHAIIAPPGVEVLTDDLELPCSICGLGTKVVPWHEKRPDGSVMYCCDRSTVNEYVPPPGSGTWAICEDCGLAFESSGGMGGLLGPDAPDIQVTFTVNGCPRCGGFGDAIHLPKVRLPDGRTTMSSSRAIAELMDEIVRGLRSGELGVPAAAEILRGQGSGPLRRLGDWLETHPVSVTVVLGILTIVATFVAPYTGPEPEGRYTEDEVQQLIETVLDHYERTQELPQVPARRGSGPSRRPGRP